MSRCPSAQGFGLFLEVFVSVIDAPDALFGVAHHPIRQEACKAKPRDPGRRRAPQVVNLEILDPAQFADVRPGPAEAGHGNVLDPPRRACEHKPITGLGRGLYGLKGQPR